MRVDAALKRAARKLARHQSLTPWLDAEVLLGVTLKAGRAYVTAHSEQPLTTRQQRDFAQRILRRQRGEPVAYVRGDQEFYGRPFLVTPAVMVPRPETEAIITAVLNHPTSHRAACPIADLGTGCGNLALTLALELPRAAVHAVDISSRALRVARINAVRLGARATFHSGDLLQPLRRVRVDMIVANLPYLDARAFPRTGTLGFEPRGALWSHHHGLGHYLRLVKQLSQRRQLPSLTCCEMNQAQVPRFCAMARKLLPQLHVRVQVINRVAFVSLTS